jgi:hypothetical protein
VVLPVAQHQHLAIGRWELVEDPPDAGRILDRDADGARVGRRQVLDRPGVGHPVVPGNQRMARPGAVVVADEIAGDGEEPGGNLERRSLGQHLPEAGERLLDDVGYGVHIVNAGAYEGEQRWALALPGVGEPGRCSSRRVTGRPDHPAVWVIGHRHRAGRRLGVGVGHAGHGGLLDRHGGAAQPTAGWRDVTARAQPTDGQARRGYRSATADHRCRRSCAVAPGSRQSPLTLPAVSVARSPESSGLDPVVWLFVIFRGGKGMSPVLSGQDAVSA